jgi:hypothetical protein
MSESATMSLGKVMVTMTLGEALTLTRGLGCHSLGFQLQWKLEGHASAVAQFTGGAVMVYLGSQFHYVGPLHISPARSTRIGTEGHQTRTGSIGAHVDLYPAQLAALEELRSHNGVMFDVTVVAEGGTLDEPKVVVDSLSVRRTFEQSAWVRCLSAAKYSDVLLIEVPALASRLPKFGDVDEAFRKSQEALMRGDYEDCVSWGRKTLERLETTLGDAEVVKNMAQAAASKGGTGEWDKADRVRFVRRAVTVLAHPAAHGNKNEWNTFGAATMQRHLSSCRRPFFG